MLSRFSNEVLSQGPIAVLPQNLSHFWLATLQKRSDDFLDTNFTVGECTETLDAEDPILTACVHEIIGTNKGYDFDLPADQLAENMTIYALSITMETIRRESDMVMTPPTLENLLSIDRIVRFGKTNPQFGRFLENACVVPESEVLENEIPTGKNWFKRLKKKIRSRMAVLSD